jgi:hypothetical protein
MIGVGRSAMFTCRALKTERRLGKQLWQVASVMGCATKYRVGWVLPQWSSSWCFEHPAPQTSLPLHIDTFLTPEDVDGGHPFHLDDFHVTSLCGDFEHERFFQHCESLVRHYFEPRRSIVCDVLERYADLLERGRVCVVVAPFYLAGTNEQAQLRKEFSAVALAKIRDAAAFAVMSDEPGWWDAHLKGAYVRHLPQHDFVMNFVLGLNCPDVIVLDSAFGWWLARLNQREGRRVFMFQPSRMQFAAQRRMRRAWNDVS